MTEWPVTNWKHGHWSGGKGTKTWKAWAAMWSRCTNSNIENYPHYGGRGIKVCERWRSFENFLADVGEIAAGMSIDRIDNDGDYCPQNVRIVSSKDQANNRSNNVRLTVHGVTKTVAQWCDETGLPFNTIRNRMIWGWSPEDCILPANATRNIMLTVDGVTKSVVDWSKETGISNDTITRRKRRGWSDERCLSKADGRYKIKA